MLPYCVRTVYVLKKDMYKLQVHLYNCAIFTVFIIYNFFRVTTVLCINYGQQHAMESYYW